MNLNKILSDRESYLSKKYDNVGVGVGSSILSSDNVNNVNNVNNNVNNDNIENSTIYQYDIIFRTMKFCGSSLDLTLVDIVKKWLVNLYS